MSKEKCCKGWGKFAIGAAIGAGLGILFAQKKGSDTRKELKIKFDEMVVKLKELDSDDVKEMIEKKIEELKEEIEDLDKEKVLKVAKKKANEIKNKSEELVELAIAKGTPVLENAANELRQKAIVVVKDVLKKLEKADK